MGFKPKLVFNCINSDSLGGSEMLRTLLLITLSVSLAVFVIPSSYAVEQAEPCDIRGCERGGWNGVPGPGPGDPSLDPSGMPTGPIDQRKFPKADREDGDQADKPRPPASSPTPIKSIGRVAVPPTVSTPMSICARARDARARNSPAAPNLEAKCRAATP